MERLAASVLSEIDELLLVLAGDGKMVVPMDFAIRRPNPISSGALGTDYDR
jgi:hypothetical protein